MAGSDGKISNRVAAVSCAAVLAVYAAGYSRTSAAAKQFEEQSAERRPSGGGRAARSEGSTEVASVAAPGARVDVASAPAREATRGGEPTAIVESSASATPVVANIAPVASAPAQTDVVAPAAPVPANPAPVAPVPVVPAPQSAPTPTPAPAAPAAKKWKDGTWYGWGTSRHGDIQAEVVIKDGKIVKSGIAQCLTRYSCDVIDILINQPVQRQSADVDYVSRATQSSDAYYYGLLEALDASTK